MAHQIHALSWQTLADNFEYVHANPQYRNCTNLYPRFKPDQGKQLQSFARDFAQLIEFSTVEERRKYPEKIEPPDRSEIFISDEIVKKIAKTVGEYKATWAEDHFTNTHGVNLTDEERRVSYWIENMQHDTFPKPVIRECAELLKALIIHGEMVPVLRLAAHPEVDPTTIWSFPENFYAEYGWSDIKECALMAYICLNVLKLKPELYDDTCRAKRLDELRQTGIDLEPTQLDYRLTSSYQRTLIECVTTRAYNHYEVSCFPHREFFGIERNMMKIRPWHSRQDFQVGTVSVEELLEPESRNVHVASATDVDAVLELLQIKGLPAELGLHVLDYAGYSARRKLAIPNDPLHPENTSELNEYLTFCWNLLVRVNMLLKASGSYVVWEFEVTECIFKLWGVPTPRMCTLDSDWEDESRPYEDITSAKTKRTFI